MYFIHFFTLLNFLRNFFLTYQCSARGMRCRSNILEHICRLPVRSVVPLKNLSIGRDQCGTERMRKLAAFFLVGQSKIIGELGQLIRRNRGKFPMSKEPWVLVSGAGKTVCLEDFRRIVRRVKAYAQQMSLPVAHGVGAELAVDRGEFVADARAEIRKRAAGIDKRQ